MKAQGQAERKRIVIPMPYYNLPVDVCLKAKIFVSCGQRTEEEKELSRRLQSRLEELGFDVYVATNVQSLRDLTEGIFANIKDSEYYIFIDFKRENCNDGNTSFYRGSLFTHQELALAKLLGLEVISFQEEGIRREGMADFIGLNPSVFTDKKSLVDNVLVKAKEQKWRSDWKNQLILESSKTGYVRATHIPLQRVGRWFHIAVRNLHKEKMAHHCAGYLEKIVNLGTSRDVTPESLVEFKWRDVTTQNVPIPPLKSRHLDAFYVFEDQPNIVYPAINPFIADSMEVLYTLRGPGKYEVTFAVFSDDFQPARETFILEIDSDIDHVRFYRKGETPPQAPPTRDENLQGSVVTASFTGSGIALNTQVGTLSPVIYHGERAESLDDRNQRGR